MLSKEEIKNRAVEIAHNVILQTDSSKELIEEIIKRLKENINGK